MTPGFAFYPNSSRQNKDKGLKWQTDLKYTEAIKKMKQCRKSERHQVGSSYIIELISLRNLHLEAFYDC